MKLREAVFQTVDAWKETGCDHAVDPLGYEENASRTARRFPPERFLELYVLWGEPGGMVYICDKVGPQATLEWLVLERHNELGTGDLVVAAAKRLAQEGYGDEIEGSFPGLLGELGSGGFRLLPYEDRRGRRPPGFR